jgi:hypothetical protein
MGREEELKSRIYRIRMEDSRDTIKFYFLFKEKLIITSQKISNGQIMTPQLITVSIQLIIDEKERKVKELMMDLINTLPYNEKVKK